MAGLEDDTESQMNSLTNKVLCTFCGKEAHAKLIITPTKELRQTVLSFPYNGMLWPTCAVCAGYWDEHWNALNGKFQADINELFRLMKANQGPPKEIVV